MRVLLTGGTGCFGRRLAAELLSGGCELVLVRARDDAHARRRAREALGHSACVVRGDIGVPGLGLGRADAALARTAEVVVHAAAVTDFGLSLEAARAANVDGTRHVLALADDLPRLEKLVHVSTAFVAGRRCGRVLEAEVDDTPGFVTAYERSQLEAERLVRASALDVPAAILRPSVVAEPRDEVGTSALWFVLRMIARGLVPVLPGTAANTIDVIPAPDAATASAQLALDSRAVGTFHVASGDLAPRVSDVVRAATGRSVRFVHVSAFPAELAHLRLRHPGAARSYDALARFVELLAYPKVFDTARAEAMLGRPPCVTDPLESFGTTEVCRVIGVLAAGGTVEG